MLMPASNVTVQTDASCKQVVSGDDSLTEGYGEAMGGPPSLNGGVDFFSSLGTEAKKKRNILDRPEPVAVCLIFLVISSL